MGYDYDLIILGGGGAGITAAMLANGLGKKVALIDKKRFGGECTWSGCVPSKSLFHAAKMMWIARHPERYGLSVHGRDKRFRGSCHVFGAADHPGDL